MSRALQRNTAQFLDSHGELWESGAVDLVALADALPASILNGDAIEELLSELGKRSVRLVDQEEVSRNIKRDVQRVSKMSANGGYQAPAHTTSFDPFAIPST